MKKRITNERIIRQLKLLKRAGIHDENDLFSMTVSDLIFAVGNEEIDFLLERLLIEKYYEDYKEAYNHKEPTLAEGHCYVNNIFETNSFNENLSWFYGITVKEFLELEDMIPNKIPFVTYYLKKYVETGEMTEPEYINLYDNRDERYLFYLEMEVFY